jgi:hypothetical protein
MRARKMTLALPICDIACEETRTEKCPDVFVNESRTQ